jgi:hypothetical protein
MRDCESVIDELLLALEHVKLAFAKKQNSFAAVSGRERFTQLGVGTTEGETTLHAFVDVSIDEVSWVWWLRVVRDGHGWKVARWVEAGNDQMKRQFVLVDCTDTIDLSRKLPALTAELLDWQPPDLRPSSRS